MTARNEPLLALTYIPEDEWHGELRIEASHAGFSGKASAWFNREDIRKFAAELRALANGGVSEAVLKGGYFSNSTTSSVPVETNIGIQIVRHNIKHLALVELADPDDDILPQRAVLRFYIEWAALYANAELIEAMVDATGRAELKVARSIFADPASVKMRYPIRRPYTPLLLDMRQQLALLIQQMEQSAPCNMPPSNQQMVTEEWEGHSPGAIIAQIDWDKAQLLCSWDVENGPPNISERSHEYVFDLSALKESARKTAHPRACFESQAAFLLHEAQGSLIDFFRDGPTDDVPFERHLIVVRGLNGAPEQTWISNVHFTFEEAQA